MRDRTRSEGRGSAEFCLVFLGLGEGVLEVMTAEVEVSSSESEVKGKESEGEESRERDDEKPAGGCVGSVAFL